MKRVGTRNMWFFLLGLTILFLSRNPQFISETEKGNKFVNSDDQSTQIPALWTPSNQIVAKQQTVAWSQSSEKYS